MNILSKKITLVAIAAMLSLSSFATPNSNYSVNVSGVSEYVQTNIDYPKRAMDNSVEGTVWVEFSVSNTGEIYELKALTKHGFGLEKEVVSTIKELSGHNTIQEGTYRVPVKFEIR